MHKDTRMIEVANPIGLFCAMLGMNRLAVDFERDELKETLEILYRNFVVG